MPTLSPPPPVNQDVDSRQYKDWFYSIYALLAAPGSTLGTMAYQNYDNVGITGGQISNVGLTSVRANGLSGYLKGNGSSSPITASATIPNTDITGLGTMSTQNIGITATITTAKLTALGANGSMTFVNGILTAQTQAT
jgi:hypothetical protein